MNTIKALAAWLYYLITKGPNYIKEQNTEYLYELLHENPTLEEVKEIFNLINGVDIHAKFDCNQTLLHAAIEHYCDTEIIEYIINQGYDVNPPNNSSLRLVFLPLFSEFDDNYGDKTKIPFYLDVLKILLDAGADPNHDRALSIVINTCDDGNSEKIALHKDVLRLCMAYGADLNKQDDEGESLLFLCDDDNMEILEFLLKQGANPNIRDKKGNTPLQSSFWLYQSIPLMKLYLQYGCNPDNLNHKKQSLIFQAVISDCIETVSILLSHKCSLDFIDIDGKKVLDYASKKEIKILLQEAGAKSVFNDLDYKLLDTIPSAEHIDEVEALLKQGANVNVSNKNSETPLYRAVYKNNEALVNLLLTYQPNLNVVEYNYQFSILGTAVFCDNIKIAEQLLKAGADVNISSRRYKTPLFQVKSLKMLQLLINHGADINAKDDDEKTVLSKIITPRIKNEAQIHDVDDLIYDTESIDEMQLLLKEGIKLEPDMEGNTIIHDVARLGNVEFLTLLQQYNIPYETLNDNGESALQFAVKFGHFDAVKYLITLGIDMNTIDKYGATALYEAGKYARREIEQYLLDHGADREYAYAEDSDVVKGNLDYM